MRIRKRSFVALALAVGLVVAGRDAAAQQPAGGPKSDSVDFVNHVMPLVNKLGCNQTRCHGSQQGKGGLRLSMFGADPAEDYSAWTRDAGGRRINKIEPRKSLLLLMATASLPHKGAQAVKIQAGSAEYNLLASWIAQGAPWGDPKQPELVSLEVLPRQQTLKKGETEQLSVTAVFANGAKKDVTRYAVYTSSDKRVAAVDGGGKVQAGDYGETPIIVSFMRRFATAGITVPQPLPSPFPTLPVHNKIDELVFAKLKALGIPPSEVCPDHVFLRRVYLDVLGSLPTPEEARAFLADKDPKKRSKLVDRLLADDRFAAFWAMKWGDLLRIKAGVGVARPAAAETYYRWVRDSLARNEPYDQFVRELLTSRGSNYESGPANFFAPTTGNDPQSFAEATTAVFMGVRIGCARCHAHPEENWTLDDDLGMAAFFATVSVKTTSEWTEQIVLLDPNKTLRHPRTGQVVPPKFLGGGVVDLAVAEKAAEEAERVVAAAKTPAEKAAAEKVALAKRAAAIRQRQADPRATFADWLVSPQNPWFAKNIVNRIWFWLLGRGIIHEPDDVRSTNPPENPELLAYLEKELVANKYDLKHVFRLILNSTTYQLSSIPNPWNGNDVAHFSHYYVKRLGAEQLLDAVSQITDTWESFYNQVAAPPLAMPAGHAAKEIPDGSTESPFLKLFGRATRDTSFESQRNSSPSMEQALYLVNSDEFQAKVANSPRMRKILEQKKSDAEVVEELYFATLSRAPTETEKRRILEYVWGAGKAALDQANAEKRAAEEALAKVKAEVAKGNLAKAKSDQLAGEQKAAAARLTEANKKIDAANAAHQQQRVPALQDVLWTLLNTKEFMCNH